MDVALARRNGAGGWDPVPIPDADGPPVACAEGQTLRLTVHAGATPGVHMGGPDLAPSSLTLRDGAVEAVFDIGIHSWAGRSRLTIQAGDRERTLALDIRPHPGKLGLDAFTDLLMELSERSAAMAWGMSPGRQAGRLAGPTATAAFPAVLDALMPELLRQVRRFLRDPPLSVQRRRDLAPLSMGRRLDTQTMRWLANHPRALSALRPGDRVVGERAPSLPQVDQPVARATHDHPVTRHLLHQFHRVGRAVDATIRRLERLSNNGHWAADPYARAAAGRLSAGCRRHRAALDDALAAPTFRACQPEAAGEGALQALPDMPAAAAVQRLSRHLLAAGLDLDAESRLEAAVKRTYDLYEVVVLYRIAAAVQSLLGGGWESSWTDSPAGEHAERPEAAVVWRRDDGSSGCVRLLYQQTFQAPSTSGSRREWNSLSGERRPDYVLSFESLGGEDVWVILDAKYRSSRTSIHEALADLHVYRDALRHRERKAAMAFIIVPALDPNAAVYAAADYVGAHAFGAIISAQGHDSVAAALQVLTDCVIGAAPFCPPSSPR